MAAGEAIARLWDTLTTMKTRRYRYLPCHVPYTSHYAFACHRGERYEAIKMVVEYLKALEESFDNLVDDLVAARMDLVRGGPAYRKELLHTAPPLTFVSSSASYAPAILATARRLPTTEEFDRVIAPTPVRAAPHPHYCLSLPRHHHSAVLRARSQLERRWRLNLLHR